MRQFSQVFQHGRHGEMAEYMQRAGEQPAEPSVEEQKEQTKETNSRPLKRGSTSSKWTLNSRKSVTASSR